MLDALLKWLYNRQNITFLIAVAGFLMSIYNFLKDFIQSRTRLRIDIQDYFRIETSYGAKDIIHVKLLNLSNRPTVLSTITIKNGGWLGLSGEGHRLGSYRRTIAKKTQRKAGVLEREDVWFSDVLPVKIEGNGCANLLIMADENDPVFQIGSLHLIKFHTARKNIRKREKINRLRDLELLLECREPSCQ